tara:strand:- start:1037 stop:1366 length:330 start_codon:yes stop_codon:yes gene_type:complete
MMQLLIILVIFTLWITAVITILRYAFHKPSLADQLRIELNQIKSDLKIAEHAYRESVRQGDFDLTRRTRTLQQDLQQQVADKSRELQLARNNPEWVADRLRELQNEDDG